MASQADFDLTALYRALDEQRVSRDLTWAAATREINRFVTTLRPIAASTITGLRTKPKGEGDGILQMLLWLRRTPESFVADIDNSDAARYQLPELTMGQILRWDTKALHQAVDRQRQAKNLTWVEVAKEMRQISPNTLTTLAKGGRTGFPHLMRIVRWLGQPAVTYTRITRW